MFFLTTKGKQEHQNKHLQIQQYYTVQSKMSPSTVRNSYSERSKTSRSTTIPRTVEKVTVGKGQRALIQSEWNVPHGLNYVASLN